MEKKDWEEELQDIINIEMFKEDLMIQIKSLVEQELDKARKGAKKEESKKLCQSISKEIYKLYSDISDKYEKLSKLTTK